MFVGLAVGRVRRRLAGCLVAEAGSRFRRDVAIGSVGPKQQESAQSESHNGKPGEHRPGSAKAPPAWFGHRSGIGPVQGRCLPRWRRRGQGGRPMQYRGLLVGFRPLPKQEGAPIADRLRALLGTKRHGRVDSLEQRPAAALAGQVDGAAVAFLHQALERRLGQLARDGPIEGRAEAVDVGPRADLVRTHQLLGGGVGRRHGVEGRLRAFTQREPRRAEIQQDRRAVGPNEDVVRLDVPVRDPRGVNGLQPVEERAQQGADLRFGQRAVAVDHRRERLALLEVHDQVGGGMKLEKSAHADDIRMRLGVAQLPQQAGLL